MMKSVTKEKVFHVLKLVLLAVTVTLVLLSLLGTVAHASGVRSRCRRPGSLQVGFRPYAFTAVDMAGRTVHFPGDFAGKYVLLDFWAYFRATAPNTPNVDATALHPPSIANFTMFSGSK